MCLQSHTAVVNMQRLQLSCDQKSGKHLVKVRRVGKTRSVQVFYGKESLDFGYHGAKETNENYKNVGLHVHVKSTGGNMLSGMMGHVLTL